VTSSVDKHSTSDLNCLIPQVGQDFGDLNYSVHFEDRMKVKGGPLAVGERHNDYH
jgi:hypothetical protein